MMMMSSLYEELGLSVGSSVEDVRKAYRRLAVQWHPDKNPHCHKQAEDKFKHIAAAYSILR